MTPYFGDIQQHRGDCSVKHNQSRFGVHPVNIIIKTSECCIRINVCSLMHHNDTFCVYGQLPAWDRLIPFPIAKRVLFSD